jgi:hypothetical protein
MKKNVRRVNPRKYNNDDLAADIQAIKQLTIEARYTRTELDNLTNNIEILYIRALAHLEQKSDPASHNDVADGAVSNKAA